MAYLAASARYGGGVFGLSEYGVVNVSATLTGVAATGTVQSVAINGFEIDLSEKLESVQATASVSSVGVGIKKVTDSVTATGSVNTVTEHVSTLLTGVEATGLVNEVEEKPTEALLSVSAIGQVSSPTVHLSKTVDSVQATLTANSVGVGASEALGSVEAVTANNTVTVNVTEKLSSVATAAYLADYQTAPNIPVGITVRTINRINVSGVAATSSLGNSEAKTTEDLLSVSATGQIGSLGVSVTKEVSSTDATLQLTTPKIIVTVVPTSVVATSALTPTVQQTNQPVEGVSATGQVNTIGISRVFQIGSVSSVTALNKPSATGFKFDYNAVRFLYNKRRTVLVERAA